MEVILVSLFFYAGSPVPEVELERFESRIADICPKSVKILTGVPLGPNKQGRAFVKSQYLCHTRNPGETEASILAHYAKFR